FQAGDGIRDRNVTGVQTCALPIFRYGTLNLSNGNQLPYADQTHLNFKLHETLDANISYDFVYGGEGKDSDLKDFDVDGKIVIIQIGRASCRERGEMRAASGEVSGE